jgi:anti-anti-sigma factor
LWKDNTMGTSHSLHIQEKNGFLWVLLPDSINMDNYVKIEQEILLSVQGPSPRVVFDLAATNNLYSSGLGLIIRLRKQINDGNGVLFLVNVAKKIRDMLEAVHLDRLFTMYATDVEFEISQEDVLERKSADRKNNFVFVAQIENGIYRITMSGTLSASNDFSALKAFEPDRAIKNYLFDLTGLDMVDSVSIHLLAQRFVSIRDQGGVIVTYGGDEQVKSLFEILSLTDFIQCCKNEHEAMDRVGKK